MENTLNIIFSGMVAISTVVYAILTWKLTSETRKSREGQTEPCIVMYPIYNINYFYNNQIDIIIENVGMGPSRNISFEIVDYKEKKNTSSDLIEKIKELSFMRNGIKILSPKNQERYKLIGNYNEILEYVKIKITYENYNGKKLTYNYEINFNSIKDSIPEINPLNAIVNELRKISSKK